MAKNSKPILSILIEEDKRTKFADLARRHSLSMGYLVNKAIDRMLETDSIDIYGGSTVASVGNYVDSSVGGMNRTDIEELIKSSVDTIDIEQVIKSYVDSLNIPSIGSNDIEELSRVSIEVALEPINEAVSELEAYTRSQFAAVREELKKAISDRSATTESIANIEATPTSSLTVGTPNSDYLDRLTELVGSGMTTKEIAEKLTTEGFTNAKGEELTRKSIESKLKSNLELKRIYDSSRTSGISKPI